MSREIRAIAHVAEGALPVIVLDDFSPVEMKNGKPGRIVIVAANRYGYRKDTRMKVATALLSVPTKRGREGLSASQRRKQRASVQRHRQATKAPVRRAQGQQQKRQTPVPVSTPRESRQDRAARERALIGRITGETHGNILDK